MAKASNTKRVLKINESFDRENYILDKDDMLGEGGFGEVFTASASEANMASITQHDLPTKVAVKAVKWHGASAKHRDTEWQLLNNNFDPHHPNLVEIFCISMEMLKKNWRKQLIYMEICSESLQDYQDRAEVSRDAFNHVLTGVLKGLDHLHSQNVIHRDLKMENILLKKTDPGSMSLMDCVVKLTDFNISKWCPNYSDFITNTAYVGTIAFRAPEVSVLQDDGKTRYGTSVDIWGVGILSLKLRMVTDVTIASEKDIIKKQLEDIPEDKADKDIKSFIASCLMVDPKDRPTAKDLLETGKPKLYVIDLGPNLPTIYYSSPDKIVGYVCAN
jgi:serine/threonine protein kinase